MRRLLVPLFIAVALAPVASAATTPPPANDDRANARAIASLPATVSGTTAGATTESGEFGAGCASTAGSVWYAYDAPADMRVVAALAAAGDLDATLEVYHRERSQIAAQRCEKTDKKGQAEAPFHVKKGESYLIRVAQLSNSVAGTFKLDLYSPKPLPHAPGGRLPHRGVSRTLDRVQDTEDAWSTTLRAGHTYRINEADHIHGCMRLAIYGPNVSTFDTAPVKRLRCGGYTLLTPEAGKGGRYSFVVRSSSSFRGPQKYRLQVAEAGNDDSAPGRFVHQFAHTRGKLNGDGIDVVDLYSFDVTQRAAAFISLNTKGGANFDVALLDAGGHRLACGCEEGTGDEEVHRGLHPGHFFMAVRAYPGEKGSYTLYVAPRAITRSKVTFNGERKSTISPGGGAGLQLTTTPTASGPVTVTIERFDPLSGWLFLKRVHTSESGGVASIGFSPPAVGKYRARGSFDGTKRTAPSNTGYAYLSVERSLTTR